MSGTARAVARAWAAPVALLAMALLACAPADPVAEVRALQASGDYAGSLERLNTLIERNPQNAELQYLHGIALTRTGQPNLGVWSFRKAMEDPKWRVAAGLQLAQSSIAVGNSAAALDATRSVLEQEPENVQALVLQAEAKVRSRRDNEGAVADAERALALDPDEIDAQVVRTVALLNLGRIDDAAAAIGDLEQRVREADLGSEAGAKFCLVRATFLKEKGDAKESEAQFDKCLEQYPENPQVVSEAAAFYEDSERRERAIEVLRHALEAEPLASYHRVRLASLLERDDKLTEAEDLLRKGTEVSDARLAALSWVDLAEFQQRRQNPVAAVSAFERAIAGMSPPPPELLFQYAEALVIAGRTDRAREVAAELRVPAHRELILARASLVDGRPAEALARFDAGMQLWPNNAVARYYAAIAAEQVGDFDRAIAEYRYAIRAGPELTDARYRLARLYEAARAYDLAIVAGRHAAKDGTPDPVAERVALRVLARLGRLAEARPVIARAAQNPELYGPAVAAMAHGVRERRGPAEAVKLVREAPGLDLTDPRSAEALRELAMALVDSADSRGALAAVDAALAKHADDAELHALRAEVLARAHAPAGEARSEAERALALDPKHVGALALLARLAADAGDADAALDLYAKSAAADTRELGDTTARRACAELLLARGRGRDAEARLAELLRWAPYDGGAARRLAELRLAREDAGDEVLSLASRAARFSAQPEDFELLSRVHRQRGEAPLADEAALRAEKARAKRHSDATPGAVPASS
jgi:tetratricopeptide (TPR) repeat protein